MRRTWLTILLLLATLPLARTPVVAQTPTPWLDTLPAAYQEATDKGRPILVIVGASWCEPCVQLHKTLGQQDVQVKLGTWTCVWLDADKAKDVPLTLAVTTFPALRVLDASGKLIASRQGALSADELIKWLDDNYRQALPLPGDDLLGNGPLDTEVVGRLVARLGETNPAIRQACVRRLRGAPAAAAAGVVEAFAGPKLAARLAALELLKQWKAPVDGLDPWQPATLTQQRLSQLKAWASVVTQAKATARPTALSDDDLAAAREQLDQLVRADSAPEALACRERLAGFGAPLLPEVRNRLKAATTDRARERLTAVRYRLVAEDALCLAWPGGLDRLASSDVQVRRSAARELTERVGGSDAPLLLEMFSDPDPSLREISLRALQQVSGSNAAGALIQLLHDPEPNVRAAVLNELAEAPSPALAEPIIAYVKAETDIDLVCHGVRVLREIKNRAAIECLIGLLSHPAWRVRGEAADALIDDVNNADGTTRDDIYAALTKLLDDSDSFVVGRAVAALRRSSQTAAIEPLIRAVAKHPELAADGFDAITSLSGNPQNHDRVVAVLRTSYANADAHVRAAALASLGEVAPDSIQQEILAGLKDQASEVRLAAVRGLLRAIVRMRPSNAWQDHWTTAQGFDDFRSGRSRPAWLDKAASDLQAMMNPEPTSDHFAVAMALTAMGHEDQTMPMFLAAVNQGPWRTYAVEALPWVSFENRVKLFNALIAGQTTRSGFVKIIQAMSDVSDVRAAPLVWDVIAAKNFTMEEARNMPEALLQIYVGSTSDTDSDTDSNVGRKFPIIPADLVKKLVADCTRIAVNGSDVQRSIALELLFKASPGDAIETARKVMADPSSTQWNKLDAFQIMLLSMSKADADTAAVEGLGDKEPYRHKVALPYLVWGPAGISLLRGQLSLGNFEQPRYSSGKIIVVTPPPGLKAQVIKPLLQDADPTLVPLAAYLLCLAGDKEGLAPLAQEWRTHHPTDELWKALVYRAATVLNDDAQTPVLEEIYRTYQPDEDAYRIREFYWTIRSMTGPSVLQLRKRIRDEVGMERLR